MVVARGCSFDLAAGHFAPVLRVRDIGQEIGAHGLAQPAEELVLEQQHRRQQQHGEHRFGRPQDGGQGAEAAGDDVDDEAFAVF